MIVTHSCQEHENLYRVLYLQVLTFFAPCAQLVRYSKLRYIYRSQSKLFSGQINWKTA